MQQAPCRHAHCRMALTFVAAPPDNQNQSVGRRELGIPPFLTKSLMIFKSMFGSWFTSAQLTGILSAAHFALGALVGLL